MSFKRLRPRSPFKYFTALLCRSSYQRGSCTSGKCIHACVRFRVQSLKGFMKEWKVCSHLCRLATLFFFFLSHLHHICPVMARLTAGCVKQTLPPTGLTPALQSKRWIKGNQRGSQAKLEQLHFFLSNILKPVVLIFFSFCEIYVPIPQKDLNPCHKSVSSPFSLPHFARGLTVFRQDLSARRRTHRS